MMSTRNVNGTRRAWLACAVIFGIWNTEASARQAPPDYGFTWSTITHATNRHANEIEAPQLYPPYSVPALPLGGVDHEYRIATTEVSVSQWFEFVQAYAPCWQGNPNDLTFTSLWIDWQGGTTYSIRPGAENRPAGMSWRVAARYVNWLHNDKRLDQDAFENGVYDTSTFSTNPDHTFNDQPVHSPDARFWISTLDEWTKAVYYDPNRYGEGQDGYWMYPNGTNTPLIPGYPEDGGQTSAGLSPGAPNAHWLDIGSYPDVLTPWGLVDASGGVGEWCETISRDFSTRAIKGSAQYSIIPEFLDRVDVINGTSPDVGGLIGIRLASVVPGPGALPGLVLGILIFATRKRIA